LTEEQQNDLKAAQEEALGPRDLRTNGKPTIDPETRELIGGVAIERTSRFKDKNRCHTLGPSRELIRKIVGPPASSKVGANDAEWDENLKICNHTLKVRPVTSGHLTHKLTG